MASSPPACNTDSALAHNLPYAGEVSPREAFAVLQSGKGMLVDVRTPPEWQAGLPDAAAIHGRLVTLSWKTSPAYTLNPNFAAEFAGLGLAKDEPLFFLCRSGGRSLDAALAMTAAGYGSCFNVTGGFESPEGWKAATLPWKQG